LASFYMDNLGLSRKEAIARAEATGSASPANVRSQALQDFTDLRNESPEFLRSVYGWERGKNEEEVRNAYVEDIVNRVHGGGSSRQEGQQQTGAPQPGTVEDGFEFQGGDPGDAENWKRVE